MEIEEYKFGEIKISGKTYNRDLKIIGDKIIPNWWRKEGHLLQLQDIEDILEYKPDIVIIGSGRSGVMEVSKQVKEYLQKLAIKYYILETEKACLKFNELKKSGVKIAACLHLTC